MVISSYIFPEGVKWAGADKTIVSDTTLIVAKRLSGLTNLFVTRPDGFVSAKTASARKATGAL